MRKVYSIMLAMVVGVFFAVSCSESNDYTDKTSSVRVISATTEIPVAGGSGTIVVTGEGITAVADDPWLSTSVDGNVVTFFADSNDGLQSRNTIVTISGANGDKAIVNVSQKGLVLVLEADNKYVFEADAKEQAFIYSASNIDFEEVISDDWIHLEKVDDGFSISVDKNTEAYRRGYVELKYKDFVKKIYVGQWGSSMPELTTLNTAVYEDKNGETQTKEVSVVENGTRKWLIKGLFVEGDVELDLSNQSGATKQQYFIPAGKTVGTFVDTVEGKEYTLRCIMSATVVSTGARYYPTSTSTLATNPYRMTFDWSIDDEANPIFGYVRPTQLGSSTSSALSSNYDTDGILGVLYNSKTSASTTYRVVDFYEMHNLRFLAQ